MRVLVLVSFLSFCNFLLKSQNAEPKIKIASKIIGLNPYMTDKELFGNKTDLKVGQSVDILGIQGDKVKVSIDGQIGFVRPDYFNQKDIEELKATAEKEKALAIAKKETETALTQRIRKNYVDSVKETLERTLKDSIFFVGTAKIKYEPIKIYTSQNGSEIGKVEIDELLLIRKVNDRYWVKVQCLVSKQSGFMLATDLMIDQKLSDSLIHIADRLERAEKLELAKRVKAILVKRYGAVISEKLIDKKIWIGMTSEMALVVLGSPEKNNRTVTANSISEQWVYELGQYYYFTNGILTSWQD
jgi:uncharacterized protein YnzC (UPF0291/DUF896 family)